MPTYYHECPDCGAHLDPGEICDCGRAEKEPPPELAPQRAAGGQRTTQRRRYYTMPPRGLQGVNSAK